MFTKKQATKKNVEPATEPASAIKFHRPKILLIDVEKETTETLLRNGYNVTSGTFGKTYKVKKGTGYKPVIAKFVLPNYTEQEIIVVDLISDTLGETPGDDDKEMPMGELDWWCKCSAGVIDPRPRAMVIVQKAFDRIYQNSGIFIIFSDSKNVQDLVLGKLIYNELSIEREIPFDNWSFLSVLEHVTVTYDHGKEISHVNKDVPLLRLLSDHLGDASFECTVDRNYRIDEEKWACLAKNKYGASVAACIMPSKENEGWIFIFPNIKNKAPFLSDFFKNILPELSPKLFPHVEGQKWVHRAEYEMPSVLAKATQIYEIQDEAAKRVATLEKAIEDDRNANQFLYALIRETGDPLVEAIKKSLYIIGFKSVVDVDAEMTKAGKEASLREDLRIHDTSPVLVVDIKGVAGKPADAEALQAQKHAFIYIQEQKRSDVRGLTIINHQRLLPPLERDNDMPFRKEILDNATQVNLGLMTGWDLFRLMRGFIQNKWKTEHVTPLFYQTGRIIPIPLHYEYLGKVKQVWKAAFSIDIEQGEVRVGERIAVEFPVDFNEQNVLSLRLNNATVEMAVAKCEVGIQREESSPKVKPGMAVYRIKPCG